MVDPALYSTLLQISRSSSQYLTIKVFLIMTIATGLFSANAARTINGNMEDRIEHTTGSDIQLSVHWDNDKPPPPPPGAQAAAAEDTTVRGAQGVVTYTEPSFITMTQLAGVDSAARVFRKDDAIFAAGGQNGSSTLYGIDTYDFGKVAWMRGGLLQYPLNSYLNLLASNPKAVWSRVRWRSNTGSSPATPSPRSGKGSTAPTSSSTASSTIGRAGTRSR